MTLKNIRIWFLIFITLVAFISLFFIGPIPQDQGYHNFSDDRTFFGLKNFWNVISNLPFIIVGVIGLSRYSKIFHAESKAGYFVVCIGVTLVGLGSSYYHFNPTNQTLLWDRLPMTIAFMGLFSLLISERLMNSFRIQLLFLLVSFGISSALYWSWTESLGRGDLRLYALVQFLPIILMPLIIFMFPSRYLSNSKLLLAFGLYILAKLFEHFDDLIFTFLGLFSGHSIKHVIAAAAVLCIIYAVPTTQKK